ncbi:hypothetical protein H072_6364 [Dactylellina haptotyla CBS 200.50]|uniref:F-box domain-containing protein n=1 Tax=Dactylellina haptotyla (strain CBS 200.50) TaxID=1284197 RepID=S8AAE1_DACHA|nr:hypothetical protein H072_6364 [Dactylellina haptotyla CBS 200.50]
MNGKDLPRLVATDEEVRNKLAIAKIPTGTVIFLNIKKLYFVSGRYEPLETEFECIIYGFPNLEELCCYDAENKDYCSTHTEPEPLLAKYMRISQLKNLKSVEIPWPKLKRAESADGSPWPGSTSYEWASTLDNWKFTKHVELDELRTWVEQCLARRLPRLEMIQFSGFKRFDDTELNARRRMISNLFIWDRTVATCTILGREYNHPVYQWDTKEDQLWASKNTVLVEPPFLRLSQRPSQKSEQEEILQPTGPHSVKFIPPEIVEQILLELPAVAVISSCRRVCKTWKTLIETTPNLIKYSTTGLKLDEYEAARTHPIPKITPLALEILSIFWKRLARNGFIEIPQATSASDSTIKAKAMRTFNRFNEKRNRVYSRIFHYDEDDDPTWRLACLITIAVLTAPIVVPFSYLKYRISESIDQSPLKPLNRSRKKVRTTVHNLIEEFAPIMAKVPLTTQYYIVADIQSRTNFNFLPDFSADIFDKNRQYPISDSYFSIIKALTAAVHNCTPLAAGNPRYYPLTVIPVYEFTEERVTSTEPIILFHLAYTKYGEEVGFQRLVFSGNEPFDVRIGNEKEYGGMHYLVNYYRVAL